MMSIGFGLGSEDEVREVNRGQILNGFIDYVKDFGFYFVNIKILRSDVRLDFWKGNFISYVEDQRKIILKVRRQGL